MNFCPGCGTKVEEEWNLCPNCGYNFNEPITATPPRQPPRQGMARSGQNSNGMIALIFGILGLFAIPFIGSIVAIIYGKKGMELDDDPSMARTGHILGILGVVCCCGLLIPLLVILFIPVLL